MSLLPYLLSELQDMSLLDEAPTPRRWGAHCCPYGPHGQHREHRDDSLAAADLLEQLLAYRNACARPASVLHYPDSPAAATLVLRPRHQGTDRRQPCLRRAMSTRTGPCSNTSARDSAAAKMAVADKDDGLLINIDVQQFRPEELSVQVLKDEGFVVVEGKHEERADEHGYVRRHFTRRYKLPASVDVDAVTSKLTSDGVLQVSAPRKPVAAVEAKESDVRHIPIAHTNQPAAVAAAEHHVGTIPTAVEDKQTEEKAEGKKTE